MRIVHTIPGLNETSGVSYFVAEACSRIAEMGHDVTILYSACLECVPSAKVKLVEADTLDALGFRPDIVHVNAVWSPFSLRAMRWCVNRKIPFVVSPHGCLMPHVFRKGRLKKTVFYWLFLWTLMRRAKRIHVTAAAERTACEGLRLFGPYAEIPIGIDLPPLETEAPARESEKRTILFVSRLGYEKGLEILLEAWKNLARHFSAEGVDLVSRWRLVLAGPDWLGYKKVLDRKIAREGIAGVEFPGALSGAVKDRAYRACDVFVLPSFTENFSMVVLEALSYAKPCIVSTGAPWGVVAERGAGCWIPPTADAFEAALRRTVLMTDRERREMGLRGRALAAEMFDWSVICQKLERCYLS